MSRTTDVENHICNCHCNSRGAYCGICRMAACRGSAAGEHCRGHAGQAVASEPTPTVANSAANVRLCVATTGNEVRYRIREQLVRLPLPNDAIGKTGEVTGGLALSDDGRIVVAESKFAACPGSYLDQALTPSTSWAISR